MKQSIFLGDTTWQVATAGDKLPAGRFLGERRAMPRGARTGDWFVLLVRRGPLDRRRTLVCVDPVVVVHRPGSRQERTVRLRMPALGRVSRVG